MDKQNKFTVPLAIVIAGALIAGAMFFSGPAEEKTGGKPLVKSLATEVSADEHILGSFDAPIKLVEYADPRCKFCRAFHPTMKKIMAEYGAGGKVAWVYRHFAILGPQSEVEAHAIECANELGGPQKFWEYLDLMFSIKDQSAQLPADTTIEDLAEQTGLEKEAFASCMESGRHMDKIAKLREMAIADGGQGTPYTLLVDSKGEIVVISGAQPYENVKQAVEDALADL